MLLCFRRIASFVLGCTLPLSLVFEDNQAVIDQLRRRDLSARTRHVRVNITFIVEAIDAREIEVNYISPAE